MHHWELQEFQGHEHLPTSHPAQSKEASQDSCGNHTCIMCVLSYSHTYVHFYTGSHEHRHGSHMGMHITHAQPDMLRHT